MQRAVLLLFGPGKPSLEEVTEKLQEVDLTPRQRFPGILLEKEDAEVLLDASDWTDAPVDEAPAGKKGGKKGGKGKPAAPVPEAPVDSRPPREIILEAMMMSPVDAIVAKMGIIEALQPVVGGLDECGPAEPADESASLRARFGDSRNRCAVLCSRSAEHGRAQLRAVLTVLRRETAVASETAPDPHGRSRWVDADKLEQFAFPPTVQHARSTARLLVFAEYGPLDRGGRLRGGRGGAHAILPQELKSMMDAMEEEDALRVFATNITMTAQQRRELVNQAGEAIRHFDRLDPARLRGLLSLVPANEDGLYDFHPLQQVLRDWRDRRIRGFQRMFGDLVSNAVDADGVAKVVQRVKVSRVPNPLSLRIGETEQFKVLSATLHKQTHNIVGLDAGRSPAGVAQNVRLLRDDTKVEGKPQWDGLCCVRGTHRGTRVNDAVAEGK